MIQCKGTTKKGEGCKIKVKGPTPYCRYHISQSSNKKKQPNIISKPPPNFKDNTKVTKPGFIYLYTLAHLLSLSSGRQPWLQIHKWGADSLKAFNPKTKILVKIGCTTSTVTHRLKQWESQCQHKLTLVNPYNTRETLDKMSIFLKNFSLLSIGPSYKNFKFDELGFYCGKDVFQIESQIHEILRQVYGYGTVHCGGCSNDGKYKIHVEWFLIPRRDLDKVFKTIDKVIERNK